MTSIRVPDTISKLSPDDTYPVVEGADVSGFLDLQAEVNSNTSKIETNIENVNNLVKTGKTFVAKVVGDTPPDYGKEPHGNYITVARAMTKTLTINTPDPTGGMIDGAIYTIYNEDPTDSIMLRAGDPLDKINGGSGMNIPTENFASFVYQLASRNFLLLEKGYIPAAKVNIANYVENKLDADDKLHTTDEIKAMVSGGTSLGITVDDGANNFGNISELNLVGIKASQPSGSSLDSVVLTADSGMADWITLGEDTGGKANSIIVEPPLQVYADPNKALTNRLRITPGLFEAVHAPGYLAYFNEPIGILGKTSKALSHADGAVYPLDVIIDNGTYIVKDMKSKAIGLQEADQDDPNVTGGTDYLVAFRVALEGKAPDDGYVQIYLAEKAEFGQPVKLLEDYNGHPMAVRRYYHKGDDMGALEALGVVNAKGLKEFTMHVVDSFDNANINVLPRDKGVSGIMVQALLPTAKAGLASVQYEVDTEQNVEFTRYYAGNDMTNLDWLSTYVMPLSEGVGGQGADFPDGLHLNNISNLMVGFVDGQMVFKDNGSNIVDFVFGKVEDTMTTSAMRGKTLALNLELTNKDAAFRVALMKWTGVPNKYTPEIFDHRDNGSPVFQTGWSLVDSLFIPEDAVNDSHGVTHTFIVPDDAVNYAVVIYPEEEKEPTELKLKTFYVGAEDPFYFYDVHQSRSLNELHLEYDKEFYESIQDGPSGYGLRYTINDDVNGLPMPCGVHQKGKADINLDPTVNQIPGSSAGGGEGALQFGTEGQATVNTVLNIASEQAQGTNHPTEFWWVTVASDGTMKEIPGSRTVFPISGDSSGSYPMTPFTFEVKAGDRIALRAKADMPDGAYLTDSKGHTHLVDVTINFKELVTVTPDAPFSDIDLKQFDHAYTKRLIVTKDVGNVSSVTLPIVIGDKDHLVVLSAVKQLADNSIRPVRALDWVYNNEDHTLKVSFGETVLIGRVTLGIYRD